MPGTVWTDPPAGGPGRVVPVTRPVARLGRVTRLSDSESDRTRRRQGPPARVAEPRPGRRRYRRGGPEPLAESGQPGVATGRSSGPGRSAQAQAGRARGIR
eukprot:750256-Hanusia_phi.AAC.4